MVKVILPDGSNRQYDDGVTAMAVAQDISAGLARAAVVAKLDDKLVDLNTEIPAGEHSLALLTDKDTESLEVLRHTAAHVLAQAVCRLYGEKVQYTIGPALMDDFQYGFYYDFDLPKNISAEDLPAIEAEMKKIVKEKLPIERIEIPTDEAKAEMDKLGQLYKNEMIDDMLADDPQTSLTFYKQGDFMDMCRGPHAPTTGKLGKAFKLLSVAGAYWRGDESRKMLTRIYGVAFFDKKQLAAHIERIEQAKKRDHRIIGKQLGLFLLDEKVGPGMPLWLPKGATLRMELENWLRGELIKAGYSMVYSPHVGRLELYKTSGHYPYYSDSQFPPLQTGEGEDEGFLLKPMNCPHHVQMYKHGQHSYRELPIRLAEFGQVYRWEQSGELSGLTRVRGFTQDDAHIFCTPDQLEAEIEACVELTKKVLGILELEDYRVRIGLRDPDSSKYVGKTEYWDQAEDNIRNVVKRLNMNYSEEQGEAAFYGPKIDFIVKDCIGREWQLGTVQVDYNLPERFDLEYIGADNKPHRPIMIHRAPFGSFERFIGILIEHFAGAFPLWLSPVQIAILPVSDKYNEYASTVVEKLKSVGIRAIMDNSPDKIGAKIRRQTLEKVPYMCIVGQREQEENNVSIRHRKAGDLGALSIDELLAAVLLERETHGETSIQDKFAGENN